MLAAVDTPDIETAPAPTGARTVLLGARRCQRRSAVKAMAAVNASCMRAGTPCRIGSPGAGEHSLHRTAMRDASLLGATTGAGGATARALGTGYLADAVRKFSERASVILLEVRLAVLPRPAARSVAAGVVARRSPRPSAAARRSSHVPGHRTPRHAASANSSPPRRRTQRPHRNMNRHVVKRADLTTARPPRPGAVATPRQ